MKGTLVVLFISAFFFLFFLGDVESRRNITDCCHAPYAPVDCSMSEGAKFNGDRLFCFDIEFYEEFECMDCKFTAEAQEVQCYRCCSDKKECSTHLAMWAMFTIVITSICCCCAVVFVVTERRRMRKGLTFAEAYSLPKAVVVVRALTPQTFPNADGTVRYKESAVPVASQDLTNIPHAQPAEEVDISVATPVGPNVLPPGHSGRTRLDSDSAGLRAPLVVADMGGELGPLPAGVQQHTASATAATALAVPALASSGGLLSPDQGLTLTSSSVAVAVTTADSSDTGDSVYVPHRPQMIDEGQYVPPGVETQLDSALESQNRNLSLI
uniref:Uncharacterized protein n=1 Tax=Fibrocapsa japonica TaxID=94617 RepID=A0A7S2UVG1_9STRA|mmetsp:Transcript_15458/g.22739  ORF Transcript_15458/g.22739 Transcript_15458/m.22739 type:complete len:326 (+) Transcript_15458:109-1086(+)|eukprot:CAMPEP_0113934664 /NCGR_PEP_ID=MMETSP1339-20121228/1953_1 /TAXON_ID=94617 /ORGANISM="Fibrocapsa japonica" /LENGTH=325 /DNA_ID=CAMNT_0000936549 /DNA_START=100 /DNA_END=1077 /DNA_ORIENTATION=+ /assembly_acc=CAM_ASM_000762